MISNINDFFTYVEKNIQAEIYSAVNIIWFRRSVYLLLLLKMFVIWPEFDMFYQHAISAGKGSFLISEVMFLPVFGAFHKIYWIFASIIVAIAVFVRSNYWLSIAIFIFSLNYLVLTTNTLDTGDKIQCFLIFMLIFVRADSKTNSISKMVSNTALIIIQIHLCAIYFVNAYGKVIYTWWRDGSIFNGIWHLSYFVNPQIIPNCFYNRNLQFITAWAVILFEFLFPVLIWFKSFKKPVIFTGLLFHFSIAILLSLPEFGITMTLAYILFYDFKK